MAKSLLLADFNGHNLSKINFRTLFFVFVYNPIPGLKFMTIFRPTQHYRRKNKMLFCFFLLLLRRLRVKYGFDISYRIQIGKGFYKGHLGNVVLHGDAVIGENCNISKGITIGVSNYGGEKGVPTIGNRVFIGPNASVFDNITIGNNVTIGANAVVTENIADGKTILPSKMTVLDKDLSDLYIHNRGN